MTSTQLPQLETAAAFAASLSFGIASGVVLEWTSHASICMIDDEGDVNECTGYRFPVFIACSHMLVAWGLCALHLYIRRLTQHTKDWDGLPASASSCQHWPLQKQATKIAPVALTTALSVVCGNEALRYVDASSVLTYASLAPLLIVILSTTFMGKRYSHWTWTSVLIFCGGVAGSCSMGEWPASPMGTAFAFLAAVMTALKTLQQGSLLSDDEESLDPPTLLYYVSPWAAMMLLIFSLMLEGLAPITVFMPTHASEPAVETAGTGMVLSLLAVGGVNTCLLNVAEFLVISNTSPLTLQVLENVRNCFVVIVFVLMMGTAFTAMQAGGLVISFCGLWLYCKLGVEICEEERVLKELPEEELQLLFLDDANLNFDNDEEEGLFLSKKVVMANANKVAELSEPEQEPILEASA
mmetsp:Transcript_30139/g.70311  ORF Transcript_30139/g.70311 Transcript_30139/m.70311 type:complete len:411 (-) Transcript_30139:115-1347(-)|eukprot:CAMPEP_0178382616 /NCGR_PEP_ID=MMETSP0689_2-20121128/6583_1 /TAXON_ID=160604 /ORGANISM="Amphidinium massartii, Strain CS-259" /LENGTH=410 /DNA_ID=CAMNT_0020002821 /DNA_START=77 /DNA_END=1309 /DNA_ORIENTATION=+